jgi:hypothetical protein
MTQYINNRRASSFGILSALAVLCAGVVAGPAAAKQVALQPADTSACVSPPLSQPFLAWNDSNFYALAPGESPGSFAGTGWTLSGGAQIKTAVLGSGATGSVLDLPAGSQAVSPAMCVTADYPNARTMVQGGSSGGIAFSVSYAGTKTANNPKKTGKIQTHAAGWSLSDPFNTNPGTLPGWQVVQFTFSSQKDHAQLYNFYVDPRMRG